MSPENDWGCVTAPAAWILKHRGWSVLDEHSKAYEGYQNPELDRLIDIAKSGSGPSSPRAEYVARELKQELTTAFRYYDPASLFHNRA